MLPRPNQAPSSAEETLSFSEGQDIFQHGDPGGDIYIIQQGEVEIYTVENGVHVTLSKMTIGEVLGVMTCLTNEPRMASARAKTEVILRRIKHIHIKRLVGNLPTWMKIVLKDFTVRLNQMNKLYTDSVSLSNQLKKNQISYIFLCSRICALLSASAKYLVIQYDNKKILLYTDIITYVTEALYLPEQLTLMLLDVMVESGMIHLNIERDNGKKYITFENAEKLVFFSQFLNEAKRGPYKKILESNLSTKELKILNGLVQISRRMGLDPSTSCQLQVKDLATSMEKMIGVRFDLECVKIGEKFRLLEITPGDLKIIFVPTELSRILVNISVYKRLEKLEETHRLKKIKKERAA